ncbi:MAG: hypothetical protein ABH950_09265 [Candidatus Altiarchaeota archaeon]
MDAYPPVSSKKKGTVEVPKKVIDEIITSYHNLESSLETLEILSNPKLLADIEESREDVKAGRLKGLDDFRKIVG